MRDHGNEWMHVHTERGADGATALGGGGDGLAYGGDIRDVMAALQLPRGEAATAAVDGNGGAGGCVGQICCRLVYGRAAWRAAQLEEEVAAGAWFVLPSPAPETVLGEDGLLAALVRAVAAADPGGSGDGGLLAEWAPS